ncbi:hypothetical protein IV203_035739 [Nitzschia inconspicua]|uniref:Uncharacterized protein n=1 Tax=Nitzschia inconspicua TaxID=303405 RepID=A0A9K3PUV5_9STRA|nr:hypothetical protein IV203_035739 [Nitzschia inconspicua]
MDNNIRINQYDSMSSTGPETLSPGSPALPSMQFTSPMPRPIPATGLDIANSQIAPSPDALAADVVTQDPIVAAYNHYTADQLAVIESIAMEASSMFCVGATFTSSGELRDSDLANCIHKVRDNTTKDLLVGTALKLKDVAVGNVEQVYSQPILDTLHSYLHLFGRTMAPQDMFAQVSRGISHREEDGENQYEPEATATLKRSKPPGANGGRRYRSRNERTMDQMKESSKRAALCSICLQPGHRIVQCSKISEARATLIGHNHVAEFAAPVKEHCPAYYPVNKVVQWILTNCTARRRKKHILSCLQKPDQEISQHLYDYGTSP